MIDPETSRALDRVFGAPSVPGFGKTCGGSVLASAEFRRVEALDRVTEEEDLDLVELLTEHLRTPGGTMTLRPIQARALAALFDYRGLLAAMSVGAGKTILSAVAGTLLESERILLLVPARLKAKTLRDFEVLADHWRMPEVRIESYEKIGRVSGAEILANFRPDLLICDEVQALKNPRAAVTRRVWRFVVEHREEVIFVGMSGTIASRSLMDLHHILWMSLGPSSMPLPAKTSEAKNWARCVDLKVTTRARPGALATWVEPGEPVTLDSVREAVGRRIFETPGVVRTTSDSVGSAILIDAFEPVLPIEASSVIDEMIQTKTDPDGEPLLPPDLWRHSRTLALGFWYRWREPGPEDWMDARRDWRRFVDDILDQEVAGFDSELQIANAVRRGKLEDYGRLRRWSAIRETFEPVSEPVWICDDVLRAVFDSVAAPSILWVDQVATGRRLEAMSGLPFFHRLGRDKSGRAIEDADPRESLIASLASNSEGRNLQAWSRSIYLSPPSNGKTLEQSLGRTHRSGQEADCVEATFVLPHWTTRRQFDRAIEDARFIESTTSQPQKILLADDVSASGLINT
jgi:hypothetical protein